MKLVGIAGPVLQALGLGAVRPPHPRQHRAAAGRRRRRGARRRRSEGAGAHLRRDAALLRGRSVRGRQAGGGRSLAQHHRRRRHSRSRSPTISISAIPSGRRSWASSSAACAASARPAGRSTSRSCPATSRSTTRPTAAASCRRRPSAASACSTTSPSRRRSPSRREGEAILLIGETQGWLGQSLYLRDICGREEGAPPPVDLDRGARERRFRARADPRGAGHRGPRLVRRRARWWRSPRWRWRPASAPMLDARARGHSRARLLVRRGPGPLSGDGAGRSRRGGDAARAGRRACRCTGSARPAATTIVIPGERAIAIKALAERFEGWLPAYMSGAA